MKKWNLIIDVALCENCNNCVLSTKDEQVGNDWVLVGKTGVWVRRSVDVGDGDGGATVIVIVGISVSVPVS